MAGPWENLRDLLLLPQQLRFAGRERDYADLAVRSAVKDDKRPLLDQLEALVTAPAAARVIAVIGGPGSGKSFTAWLLQQRLQPGSRKPRTLAPFYLSLAHVPCPPKSKPDLYETAHYIGQQYGGPNSPPPPVPPAPRLFILDDASLATPPEKVPEMVATHLERYPRDLCVLLLHNDMLLEGLVPQATHMAILKLDGFTPAARYKRGRDEKVLPRIEYDRATWPLLMETRTRHERQLDLQNWTQFHDSLRRSALATANGGAETASAALANIARRAPSFVLRLPPELIEYPRTSLVPAESTDRHQRYAHADLFIYSKQLGLIFANSAVYASLIATAMLNEALCSPDKPVLQRAIEDLPINPVMADLIVAAYISTLIARLDQPPPQGPRINAARLLAEISDVLLFLVTERYDRSLVQLCHLLPYLARFYKAADTDPKTRLQLDKAQLQQLQQVLLNAFPTVDSLRQCVRWALNLNLEDVTDSGDLGTRIFNLMVWAEAHGQVPALIQGALRANATNPALQAFGESVGIAAD